MRNFQLDIKIIPKMNIDLKNESSTRKHSSILENEKRFIQQAYQNAADKFGLEPNKQSDHEDPNSNSPIHKYVSKKCEPNNQLLKNTFNSIQFSKLVCHMKWVKNAESKWIPLESNHVKEHGDYSSFFCDTFNNQELSCRKSSSDSILTNLKETESQVTVLNTQHSPNNSTISFDKQSNQDIQLE